MTVAGVAAVVDGLAAHDYLADEGLATAVFLALRLQRPLLLEGEAGVGKTEVAKVLARWTGGRAAAPAVLRGHRRRPGRSTSGTTPASSSTCAPPRRPAGRATRRRRARGRAVRRALPRPPPAAAALDTGRRRPPPVLLIDEVDRADDEFEAFLLEILSDWSVTVPELGTFRATVPPVVVLTSNRTRDVHDALKRRCLYHWVEHPDFEREVAIVRLRAPEVDERARPPGGRRRSPSSATLGLYKPPGVAETIDWARALAALGRRRLDAASVDATLGAVVKYREDAERVARRTASTRSCATAVARSA